MSKKDLFARRQRRVRTRLKLVSEGRARLSVCRSSKNIYAQIIDDKAGKTLAFASTVTKEYRAKGRTGGDIEAAKEVGRQIAVNALKAGVKEVYFDRGAYLYHGRVKALAETAREAGLSF